MTAVTLMKTLGSSSVATTIVDEIGLRTVDGHRMMIGQELGA